MAEAPLMPAAPRPHKQIASVLDAAAKDPTVMTTLRETAFAADAELVAPMMRWRVNGQPAGNGWASPANNGAFGTDYVHRMGAVKADPYDNKRNETMYFYTDNDFTFAPIRWRVVLRRHLPTGAASAGQGLLVADRL